MGEFMLEYSKWTLTVLQLQKLNPHVVFPPSGGQGFCNGPGNLVPKGFASFERYPKMAVGNSKRPRVLTTRKCVGLHKGSIRSMGACEWESTENIHKSFLLKCQTKNVGLNGLIGCLHKMVSPLNTEVLIRGASSNGRPFVLGFI